MAVMHLLTIIATSIILYFVGSRFTHASSNLGDYFRLPRSVKGATFDAISSSLPELMIALFSVLIFKKFEVGIGTIAGSALFNLLIIPGICVLVAPVAFRVSKDVVAREGIFYMIAVFALLAVLMYTTTWVIAVPFGFLLIYGWYVHDIVMHTKNNKQRRKPISFKKECATALICVLIIGIATYFMTEAAIELAEALGISPLIIAFTVVAAATSVPDAIISILNAKQGNIDDAVSNVFGSNIFDILVGLSIPLLLAIIFMGPFPINFPHLELIVGLLGASIIVLYLMAQKHMLTRKQGISLLFIYLCFLAYVVFLSFQ
ncbi:MAG: hypothetical protein OXR66_00290 [Candidatus Woesearchaeota archaeon]|nr:hypothetical protein [Candidatus Woesearchaeota archaeon]